MICLSSFSSITASAQTILSVTLPATNYCEGDSIPVSYVTSGAFGTKNVFTVQLSDGAGSFVSTFTNVGSLKSQSSGTIVVPVKTDITPSTHYRVRVISSIPYVVGPDNGSDLTLSTRPIVRINASRRIVLVGDTGVKFTGSQSATIAAYHWDFGQDATPATYDGANPPLVTYSSTGIKTVSLSESSIYGCSSIADSLNQMQVNVTDCFPTIPHSAFVDSTSENPNGGWEPNLPYWQNAVVWAVPGSVLNPPPGYWTIFAEPGSTVTDPANGEALIYLKPGASFSGRGYRTTIIRAPGASVKVDANSLTTIIDCPSLDFDYSVAPPYKIKPAESVALQNSLSALRVYPIPAQNAVSIMCEATPLNAQLMNDLGERVLTSDRMSSPDFKLDVSNLAAGVYRLILVYPDHQTYGQVVITH